MRLHIKIGAAARAVLTICATAAATVAAAQNYEFNHGPYLQGLTDKEVTVFFTTSARGASQVEMRKAGDEHTQTFVTTINGLVEANNTMNAIRMDGLEPATRYEYRLVSREICEFKPYSVTYGDTIRSPWYPFTTFDRVADTFAFAVVSDMHDKNDKYRTLLSHMPMDSVQMAFLVGDMISYFNTPDQPYTGFIDTSVDVFARSKPFAVVRGNHETRGHQAREYGKFIQCPDGHFYGFYRIGDTAVVMLDSGEDKPDNHREYSGLTAFDEYRQEQVEWLKRIVRSSDFRKARHRIVMVHIPPVDSCTADGSLTKPTHHGGQEVYDLFMPTLNAAGVDLMICGHTHKQMLFEREKGRYGFPVVVNDNNSASYVRVSPQGIRVRTVNIDGKTTLDRLFR